MTQELPALGSKVAPGLVGVVDARVVQVSALEERFAFADWPQPQSRRANIFVEGIA